MRPRRALELVRLEHEGGLRIRQLRLDVAHVDLEVARVDARQDLTFLDLIADVDRPGDQRTRNTERQLDLLGGSGDARKRVTLKAGEIACPHGPDGPDAVRLLDCRPAPGQHDQTAHSHETSVHDTILTEAEPP